ncbi:MAG: type II toxin-antitoxin system VapC family toxin [Thermoanaerobaculia bacterium]
MIVVDSSALLAIIFREPEHDRILERLIGEDGAGIPAPTLLEASIVASSRLGRDASALIHNLLEELEIAVIPFDERHARSALSAWLRFGERRHPADLNFGDCIAYAVAQRAGMPLLCVGGDFPRTDLELA